MHTFLSVKEVCVAKKQRVGPRGLSAYNNKIIYFLNNSRETEKSQIGKRKTKEARRAIINTLRACKLFNIPQNALPWKQEGIQHKSCAKLEAFYKTLPLTESQNLHLSIH